MPTRYDSDDDSQGSGGGDREISLGTGTVLGIFLALALVCSLFFGLGYSMGRKSGPASSALGAAPPSIFYRGEADKQAAASSTARPGESYASGQRAGTVIAQPVEAGSSGRDSSSVANPPSGRPTTARPGHDRAPSAKPSSASAVLPVPSATPVPLTAAEAASQSFVQIAAVSRKEDADLLLTALKRRGYTGQVRPQPADKLLHIQVGPFGTRKDAEAMRQRLIIDGYNPIIK